MAQPAQRRVLGALFAVLALAFTGVAVTAARAVGGQPALLVIVVAAAALALWLGSLALKALRSH